MRMKRTNTVLAVAGAVLLAIVGTRIGWFNVVRQLQAVRLGMLILIGLSILRLILQTHAWSSALRSDGIRARTAELIGIRLAAQSIGYLSVLGPLISEPMRISLLRKYKGKGMSATLADAGVYGFSSGLFGIADCVCAGVLMAHSCDIAELAELAAVLAAGIFLIAQRRPLLSSLVCRLGSHCPEWLKRGEQIEIQVRQFESLHNSPIRRISGSTSHARCFWPARLQRCCGV